MAFKYGRAFYETTSAIHHLMLNYDFMNQQCLSLGRVECNILKYLITKGEPIKLTEIKEKMEISVSRTTQVLTKLEKKGYVTRTQDIEDRRIWRAEITPAGIDIAKKYNNKNINMFNNFLKQIPEEDIEPIYEALDAWCEILSKVNQKYKEKRK